MKVATTLSTKNQELDKKIDVLINRVEVLTIITTAALLKDKQLTDKVSILLDLGLDSSEVATALRTSQNSVRSIKSRLSKKQVSADKKMVIKKYGGKPNGRKAT